MTFSQRIGKTPVKTELEKEGISEGLRNALWTKITVQLLEPLRRSSFYIEGKYISEESFYNHLWVEFMKQPIDTVPQLGNVNFSHSAISVLRSWYFEALWFEVFDLVEFLIAYNLIVSLPINRVLREEYSAYRLVDGIFVQVNSKVEVVEMEVALNNLDPTSPAREHLRQAMVLFSDRVNPDYRNSVKESISAIESLVKILLHDDKASFGQAMRKLEEDHGIHPAMKKAFGQLYGYTSDSGGIRHAIKDGDAPVEAAEARFMLVTCSTFVNYLITKLN